MRWEELFADLEAQLEQAGAAELRAELAERTRWEVAQVRLADRLATLVGHPLHLRVLGAGAVEGVLADTGPDWVLLDRDGGRRCLVPLAGVLAVSGLGRRAGAPPPGRGVRGRLRLAYALRALARDRAAVTVVLLDGSGLDGTLERVGADFVEVAEHGAGEPRRADGVHRVRALPHAAGALVRGA